MMTVIVRTYQLLMTDVKQLQTPAEPWAMSPTVGYYCLVSTFIIFIW